MPDGRVLIALDDGPLTASPTWTRIDDVAKVAGIEIRVGRPDERGVTQTGEMVITVHDRDGLFDRSNFSSPYFGKLDGKQIVAQLFNPVTAVWHSRARMLIDEIGVNLRPSQFLGDVQIVCVGFFDYLARFKFLPGVHGDPAPAASAGAVFFEDGEADERIRAILEDNVGIHSTRHVTFSLNVRVQETLYDPDDDALGACFDASQAEFPGLASTYEDRFGRIVTHGRFAITDPEGVIAGGPVPSNIWDFTRWKMGTGSAVSDPEFVQIRPPLQWRAGRRGIVNAAMCLPENVDEDDIPGQVVVDATSIAAYGYHPHPPFIDLIVSEHKTNGNDALDECLLYATAWVENLKEPRHRIDAITVRSIGATDPRATAVWDCLTRLDISDGVELLVTDGAFTMSEDFYVQGWQQTIRPGSPIENGGVDIVELSINTSPAWSIDVFS